MIEKQVTAYLKTKLSCAVYMGEKPNNPPNKYVVIKIIDAGRNNFIDEASLILESHDTTLQKCAELNEEVKNAMFDITILDNVSSSKLGGSGGQHIDTQTKTYAYQCVFNLFYTQGE